MSGAPAGVPPRVAVLADDLIWATRLAGLLRAAGAEPVPARAIDGFTSALGEVDGAIVDLTARAYDGLAGVAAGRAAGLSVIAVAQHDDAPLRSAARAAGAQRVYAYRTMAEHGDREVGRWLATLGTHAAGTR